MKKREFALPGNVKVFFKSSEDMSEIEPGTVFLVFTSSPYYNYVKTECDIWFCEIYFENF